MREPESDAALEWEASIAAALRDEPPGADVRHAPLGRVAEAATVHGVAPLLHYHLTRVGRWKEWPPGLEAALERRMIRAALVAERRRIEIEGLLERLSAWGIDVLLMKGVPLAYTHYQRPGLRPALDTDLLVPAGQTDELFARLEELGYARSVGGSSQVTFLKADACGSWHNLDCHWAISGNVVPARDFPFAELAARSVGVPGLGSGARALGPVDALLLCGIHFAHHLGRERLVWLYDVRLLARSLDGRQQTEFEERARERRVGTVCAAILERTERRLGPIVPEGLIGRLRTGPRWLARLREPSAAFLPGRSPLLFESLATLRNLEGRRERAWFLRKLLLGSHGAAGTRRRPSVTQVARRVAKGMVRYVIQGRPVQR